MVEAQAANGDETPESYLGLGRLERFASNEKASAGKHTYSLPKTLALHHIAYQGSWTLSEEAAKAGKGSALEIQFMGDKVYLVIGPGQKGGKVTVRLDGKPIGDLGGVDIQNSRVLLDTERLYNLVDLKGKGGPHLLRLEFENQATSVYAFTFG